MTATCKQCKHWAASAAASAARGICRRYAPRPLTTHAPAAATQWPETAATDTCGDFAKSEAKAPKSVASAPKVAKTSAAQKRRPRAKK